MEKTGLSGIDAFHTIHNYIDTDEMILRKGAIAAHEGEKVLISVNMRDGSIGMLCRRKGILNDNMSNLLLRPSLLERGGK